MLTRRCSTCSHAYLQLSGSIYRSYTRCAAFGRTRPSVTVLQSKVVGATVPAACSRHTPSNKATQLRQSARDFEATCWPAVLQRIKLQLSQMGWMLTNFIVASQRTPRCVLRLSLMTEA